MVVARKAEIEALSFTVATNTTFRCIRNANERLKFLVELSSVAVMFPVA